MAYFQACFDGRDDEAARSKRTVPAHRRSKVAQEVRCQSAEGRIAGPDMGQKVRGTVANLTLSERIERLLVCVNLARHHLRIGAE